MPLSFLSPPGARIDSIIGRAPGKMKIQSPLFKHDLEFQDRDSRALSQPGVPSVHGAWCNCSGYMPGTLDTSYAASYFLMLCVGSCLFIPQEYKLLTDRHTLILQNSSRCRVGAQQKWVNGWHIGKQVIVGHCSHLWPGSGLEPRSACLQA